MSGLAAPPPRPVRLAQYQQWLERSRGLRFASYDELWQWSTTEIEAFWASLWDFFEIESPTPWLRVLDREVMPGARWFDGAQVSWTRQVFRHAAAAHAQGHPAVVYQNERLPAPATMSWPELQRQVGSMAARLRQRGIGPGDRVCAYLANTPATLVAFLGCAAVGALWSVCSPDMGPVAVLDRFRQIEPRLLLAVDGQTWGGTSHDRSAVVAQVLQGLPSVEEVVWVPWHEESAAPDTPPAGWAAGPRRLSRWAEWVDGDASLYEGAGAPAWLPFSHPLWVVYSSGTTGLPKALVHGQGGVMLEMLKGGALHNDIAPSAGTGERFHWFSSTGWIMWNAQVGALLGGTTVCLYDGNPGGRGGQDWGTLWRFAAAAGVTWFGAGAAFYASCLKADVHPQAEGDLSRLHAIGSTGSPLSEACYDWIWARLPRPQGRDLWLNPISGGTDFAGAFVAGNRLLPVERGVMQCRCLGAAVAAFDEAGRSLIGEVGELVCTRPMPSMPLFLWGDGDGRRYRDSYFDTYPGGDGRPRAWRHGDWLRLVPAADGGAVGAVIYGRSDATINRHGVRMGTAELYRAVEALPEVLDSLVVDLEMLGRDSAMPLFVVLRPGQVLDEALTQRMMTAIRQALSPRHVPSTVVQVQAVPRTLSGKKMELPVKKLLLGADPAQVFHADAMANPEVIAWFAAYARRQAASPGSTAPADGAVPAFRLPPG